MRGLSIRIAEILTQIIEFLWRRPRRLTSILVPHVGKFLKSDVLLKLPSGRDRADLTVKKTVRVLRIFLVWGVRSGLYREAPVAKRRIDGKRGASMSSSTSKQIDDLTNLSYEDLRTLWRTLYGTDAPTLGRAYIFKRLAYKAQEITFDGLSESTRNKMRRILITNVLR